VYAKTLATNGAKVYITGRRLEVLETSARIHGSAESLGPQGGTIIPLVLDVTSKDSITAAVDHIAAIEGYVNV
jgi:NADP-dependent 3-hydroxy acid dehydrogenase YdfG